MAILKFAVIMILMLFYGGAFVSYSKSEDDKDRAEYSVMILILWLLTTILAVLWEV